MWLLWPLVLGVLFHYFGESIETRFASNAGPARKYYRPTPDGYQALQEGTSSWASLVAVVGSVLNRPLPAEPIEGS